VAETRREALEAGKRGFDRWYASLQHLWRLNGNPMTHYPIPEDFHAALEMGVIQAGTPDQVAEGIAREIEASGANYVLARLAFGDLTFDEALQSATLFAREVMPRFADQKETA
jgi:alkanesulfonate monooxygenase SsuD/methylene tetrahydromethanopterin reductase-like flavin-dependent oxidoreductase (luciferase family)